MFNALFFSFVTPTRIKGSLYRSVSSSEIEALSDLYPTDGLLVSMSPVVPDTNVVFPGSFAIVEVK